MRTHPIVVGMLGASLMAIGCGAPPDEFEVRINPAVSCVDCVLDAMADWESKTAARFHPVITPFGCDTQNCTYIEEVPSGEVKFDSYLANSCVPDGSGCTLTMPDTHTSHIKIKAGMSDKRTRLAAIHEIGHTLLGPQHAKEVGESVMCAELDLSIPGATWLDVRRYWLERH